jgi:hypothetical protein
MRVGKRAASRGIAVAALVFAVLGLTAQAQVVVKTPKSPACSKMKDEAACNGRESCTWSAEVRDAKGKVTKRGACRARPKGAQAPRQSPSNDTMEMMKKSKNLPEQKSDAH